MVPRPHRRRSQAHSWRVDQDRIFCRDLTLAEDSNYLFYFIYVCLFIYLIDRNENQLSVEDEPWQSYAFHGAQGSSGRYHAKILFEILQVLDLSRPLGTVD